MKRILLGLGMVVTLVSFAACSSSSNGEEIDYGAFIDGRYAMDAEVSDNVAGTNDLQRVYADMTRVSDTQARFTTTIEIGGQPFPVDALLDLSGVGRPLVDLAADYREGSVQYVFSGNVKDGADLELAMSVYLDGDNNDYASVDADYYVSFEGVNGGVIVSDDRALLVEGDYDCSLEIRLTDELLEPFTLPYVVRITAVADNTIDFIIEDFAFDENMVPFDIKIRYVELTGPKNDIKFEFSGLVVVDDLIDNMQMVLAGNFVDQENLNFDLFIPDLFVDVAGSGQKE